MDDRIVEFVQALRAAGVRVSLAESADSLRAIEQLGAMDRSLFRAGLRATLVKEQRDFAMFDQLFPAFFEIGPPPMRQPGQSGMSDEQQAQMDAAMQQLMQQLSARLQALLERLMAGQQLTREELETMAQQAGMQRARSASPQMQRYIANQMQRQMGLGELQELLEQLEAALAEQGMDAEGREQTREMAEGNAESLEQQIDQYVGQNLARQIADQMRHDPIRDLTNRPIDQLGPREIDLMRDEVRRMAARLRTRAALRNRRHRAGALDAKA
ncbi:MAG TPA: hypothetical protein VLA19_33555, partial [Herpetosiphonaceae bacterium]|nr:hypothetical protein [Herpetosiphonaceae bacterium]